MLDILSVIEYQQRLVIRNHPDGVFLGDAHIYLLCIILQLIVIKNIISGYFINYATFSHYDIVNFRR